MHFCKRKRIGSTLVAKWHEQKVQKDHDHFGPNALRGRFIKWNSYDILYHIFFGIDSDGITHDI